MRSAAIKYSAKKAAAVPPQSPRNRNRVVHAWERPGCCAGRALKGHSTDPPDELEYNIETGIPFVDFAEPKIGQSDGGVEVGAGSLAHGRTNDKNRGRAHGHSHHQSSQRAAGQKMQNGQRRIKKPNSEEARRDHEDRKFDAFIDIETPMAPECSPQRVHRSRRSEAVSLSRPDSILLSVQLTCALCADTRPSKFRK